MFLALKAFGVEALGKGFLGLCMWRAWPSKARIFTLPMASFSWFYELGSEGSLSSLMRARRALSCW